MKGKQHTMDKIDRQKLDLALTEAISVVNTKTTQGRLNALRDIKESGGIKSKTKTGQAYEKRHV